MRSTVSRVTTTLLISVLLVACAPAASPAPSMMAGLSARPSSSAASAVPSAAVTESPAPTPEPPAVPSGWPYTIGDSEAIFGSDGTTYLLARDTHGEYGQIVVALDAAGHVKPGWPIEATPDLYFGSLAVGPDGSVYLAECGESTLDDWTANLIARLVAKPGMASTIRRDLRRRGIAAFGMLDA